MEIREIQLLELDERVWDAYAQLVKQGAAPLDTSEEQALLRAGLAREHAGELVPVDVAGLLLQLDSRADRARSRARRVAETMAQAARPGLVIEAFGPASVHEHFERIQERAVQHVRFADRMPHLVAVEDQQLSPAQRLAAQRQVHYRSVYDEAALQHPTIRRVLAESLRLGEEARVIRKVPLRMLIIDEKEALILCTGDRSTAYGLLCKHPAIVSGLIDGFELLWRMGIPLHLDVRGEPQQEAFDAQTRHLISLLSMGLTDQAIARELGVSERTAGRRIARLMDHLGARCRFQLGVQAARRGWIG